MLGTVKSVFPKKSTIAHAVVAPALRPAVQGLLNPTDEFTKSEEATPMASMVAKGAGVTAGTVAGMVTTAVCATKYPVAAICEGTATCAAVLSMKDTEDLP